MRPVLAKRLKAILEESLEFCAKRVTRLAKQIIRDIILFMSDVHKSMKFVKTLKNYYACITQKFFIIFGL